MCTLIYDNDGFMHVGKYDDESIILADIVRKLNDSDDKRETYKAYIGNHIKLIMKFESAHDPDKYWDIIDPQTDEVYIIGVKDTRQFISKLENMLHVKFTVITDELHSSVPNIDTSKLPINKLVALYEDLYCFSEYRERYSLTIK